MLGVDRADKLIDRAQAFAAEHSVGNTDFEVMSLDALTLPDESVDAPSSQFGFLDERDLVVSVNELPRALKKGRHSA